MLPDQREEAIMVLRDKHISAVPKTERELAIAREAIESVAMQIRVILPLPGDWVESAIRRCWVNYLLSQERKTR